MKRVLVPKSVSVPSSVTNKSGHIISDPFHIKEEYRKESKHRLRTREIDNELKHFELVQNSLCKMRLRKCSKSLSPDFTLDEVQKVLTELKLKHFELVQNSLCKMRLRKCSKSLSPDFTLDEVQKVLTELKSGKCRDPSGLIREVFKYAGREMLLSLHHMVNQIKRHKRTPSDWDQIWVKIIKKKKGTWKYLDNYCGIFIVSIVSVILEKLIKNRIMTILSGNMTQFQNGGIKGKGVVNNLFIVRGIINHAT